MRAHVLAKTADTPDPVALQVECGGVIIHHLRAVGVGRALEDGRRAGADRGGRVRLKLLHLGDAEFARGDLLRVHCVE